jgi:four helix bundle protein
MQNYNPKFKSDLKARCYRFSLDLIKFIDILPRDNSALIIGKQLLRSGTSIGANLVEAGASSSRLEFKKFHEIALKSANETKYWLGLLKDSDKASKDRTDYLLSEVGELSSMIASGILKLKGKR